MLVAAAVTALTVFRSDLRTQPTAASPVTEPTTPCANRTVVPEPAANPELVADCVVLLGLRDTLRGTATLNWSAERALTAWDGVTVARSDGVKRVTELSLDSKSLDGTIPAELGQLSALFILRLGWNQLSGAIPPELGRLTQLGRLTLSGNRLTGSIPPELAQIGPSLTTLAISGPSPLPEGVGLSGAIPPQLGNLTNLQYLWLDGNRLSGSIPTRLGRLTELLGLHLQDNQLSGPIPTQLGSLSKLIELQLGHNQLSGVIPTQLADLGTLRKLYLKENSGLTGCVPSGLSSLRYNDIARLNLTDCAADAAATPETPLPTYMVTVTAGPGGAVEPSGASSHPEGARLSLTASWNDATHTFGAWSGGCTGTATTCRTAELYSDLSVTATFTALEADRCAAPADVDCIRAVYLGAPEDYVQVQDIPAEQLLSPDPDGRYQAERGQQITVVTAAPLPSGWTRFYLQRSPLGQPRPVSQEQLIRPIGTTYTFTLSQEERAATLITYRLTAARPLPIQRPGIKPELGRDVVTTRFRIASSTLQYGAYDAMGEVTARGSFAFLSDPDDASSAVTTYEGLRDGTTAALLIHETDGFGASQSELYDAVAPGDLFEWHQAEDCFVRYSVTEVKPDPAGPEPRKLLSVEWMTYAFTGCSGAIGADAEIWFRWGELQDLGGADLGAPVVHGPFQIVPEGWSGAVLDHLERTPVGHSHNDPGGGWTIAEARTLPFWRDPMLPEGMEFIWASSGDVADPVYGYKARFEGGGGGIYLYAHDNNEGRYPQKASWLEGRGARETRIIAGRPAVVIYSPPGPSFSEFFPVTVWVYDHEYDAVYEIRGLYGGLRGGNVDAVIAIARGLFQREAQP